MKEIDMKIKQTLMVMMVAAMLSPASIALAQSGPIDKAYEDGKAAEISSVKLRLATQSATVAVQELNEAEGSLRRLKEAKASDLRRKIAAELEMAITRLKIAAGGQ
ncbi:hypothetical protein WV31_00035 [Magnetospirillum sp. ME-1]|nr:hypothetical protein WV31_00035 [Magnetospirillum sp. ME-1]